jgi:DNA-directed RNA polymerase subunit K/omega
MGLSYDSDYDSGDNLSTTSSAHGGAAKKKPKRPTFLEEEDFASSEEEEAGEEDSVEGVENSSVVDSEMSGSEDEDDEDDEENQEEEEEDENGVENGDENEEDEEEVDENDIPLPQVVSRTSKTSKKNKKKSKNGPSKTAMEEEEILDEFDYQNEDEDFAEDKDDYYQKIKNHVERSRIFEDHPELRRINHEEMEALCRVVRDDKGRIVDPLHTTLPFLTKYEKADVLGKRAAQINEGAPLFTEVDPSIIDGSLIALKEFEEKKIPFIVQRPLPNGAMEYWRLQDLELL